jgi:hypothetical protein
MKRYEYKVLDTGKGVEQQLNALGAQGWQVVGVTTKKQLFIAPPQAVILMRDWSRPTCARAPRWSRRTRSPPIRQRGALQAPR